MEKTNIYGYSKRQMEDIAASFGQKPYRGRQLYKWLYNSREYDFNQMTDIPLGIRQQLLERYEINRLSLVESQLSSDGTQKFLFALSDGLMIETVMIPADDGRSTVCISSQVGCALTCGFCATGTMGLSRDLTVGEIVGQLLYLRDEFGEDTFSNIVFMGMGEPLHNYDNVIAALEIMTSEIGMDIPPRKITISTSGISPKIRKLADCGIRVGLAISLHAAVQSKRAVIMPVAQTFDLWKLMDAVKYFSKQNKSSVTFEYILFKGFNDGRPDIKALVELVGGISCKINVLAYNPVKGLDFERPSDETVNWFAGQLNKTFPSVTVRKSRGLDISAACGQLAVNKNKGRATNALKH